MSTLNLSGLKGRGSTEPGFVQSRTSLNSFSFLFFNLWYRFSAGVGRAGTFCVIYTAIRELNGTGNIGKDAYNENNYCHALFSAQQVYCKIRIF